MTKRIFRSISIVALSIFVAAVVLFMGVLFDYFSTVQRNQLKMQTTLAAQGVANEGADYFEGLDINNYRITWIDSDGKVLFDSKSNSSKMENHFQREEIKQALENGYGESSRYSSTLMERSFYSAELLPDGTVLRLSISQNTILTLLLGMAQPICAIFIAAIILSLVLAARLAKNIVKPLNNLNLDDPLCNDDYEELSPLLRRIDSQQKQIKRQGDKLRQKQLEFETVTTGMKEGIVLLNNNNVILSINKAAMRMLGADSACEDTDILSVNRSLELQQLLENAKSGGYTEKRISLGGNDYQFNASPVSASSGISGIVLLILDITEKEKSERMRREFTANVSHELKTPLHTISGCAELMKDGMVKSEDIQKFSNEIYTQTQRMINLIDDIIKLSHLDEGAEDMKRENIDLYDLAESTAAGLSETAKAADVSLKVTGEHAVVFGIHELIQGIIYNLCDNAVKYNKAGGSAEINVTCEDKFVTLTVSDTGIGIPQEHFNRIFERFYRVDKSHSKEVGGTGLGLSIVKHAAQLHDAVIDLQSTLGEGTTVKVKFPVSK